MMHQAWLRIDRHPRVDRSECGATLADTRCATRGYELVRKAKAAAMLNAGLR